MEHLLKLASSLDIKSITVAKRKKRLSLDQAARIGTEYTHRKQQLRKHQFAGGKEAIGCRDNRLNRLGSVVYSSNIVQKTDGGSEILMVVAKREYERYDGAIIESIDYDFTVRVLGADLVAMKSEHALLVYDNLQGVCLHCLTSAFVKKVRRNKDRGSDVLYFQCTRCNGSSEYLG